MTEKIIYEISVSGNASQEFEKANKTYNDFKKNIEAPTKELPLTRQLRDIKLEMQKLDQAGQGVGNKQFDELAKQAGSIRDSMNAANDAIRTNAVGTEFERGMNVACGAFEALNGSAQVVTGTMALFGMENKNVEKSIQQMMGLMSMANGVKMVYNALTKEGALVTALLSMKNKAAAVTQALFTKSMWASVTATKALKAALITSGIGAIAVVIGTVVEALMNWKSEADNVANSANNIANAYENAVKWAKEYYTSSSFAQLTPEQQTEYEYIKAKEGEDAAQKYKLKILGENEQAAIASINKIKKAQKDADLELQMMLAGMNYSGQTEESEGIKTQKQKIAALRLELAKMEDDLKKTQTAIITTHGTGNKNKKSSTLQNKETQKLINAAPKTFNVYINELGAIREVNIMSDEDEVKFQQKMVGVLTSALQTIQVQQS